jgi:hypothetical protein
MLRGMCDIVNILGCNKVPIRGLRDAGTGWREHVGLSQL